MRQKASLAALVAVYAVAAALHAGPRVAAQRQARSWEIRLPPSIPTLAAALAVSADSGIPRERELAAACASTASFADRADACHALARMHMLGDSAAPPPLPPIVVRLEYEACVHVSQHESCADLAPWFEPGGELASITPVQPDAAIFATLVRAGTPCSGFRAVLRAAAEAAHDGFVAFRDGTAPEDPERAMADLSRARGLMTRVDVLRPPDGVCTFSGPTDRQAYDQAQSDLRAFASGVDGVVRRATQRAERERAQRLAAERAAAERAAAERAAAERAAAERAAADRAAAERASAERAAAERAAAERAAAEGAAPREGTASAAAGGARGTRGGSDECAELRQTPDYGIRLGPIIAGYEALAHAMETVASRCTRDIQYGTAAYEACGRAQTACSELYARVRDVEDAYFHGRSIAALRAVEEVMSRPVRSQRYELPADWADHVGTFLAYSDRPNECTYGMDARRDDTGPGRGTHAGSAPELSREASFLRNVAHDYQLWWHWVRGICG